METRKDVVVIGGGAAGMSASSRVRRLDPNARITVLEATEYVSHAPCGIPYFLEGLFDDPSLFMNYTPSFFKEKRNINVLTGAKVVEADFSERRVTYEKDGEKVSLEFDHAVLATGAKPVVPRIEGVGGERVHLVHHPAEAPALRASLSDASRVVIVGGGVLGLELAEAMSAKGRKVTLIHRGDYPLSRVLDEDVGKYLGEFASKRIELRMGESLVSVGDGGRSAKTDSGVYEADAVILSLGVEPNVTFGGLQLGAKGAVATNGNMETSVKGVFAAGDVADSVNVITHKRDWQPYAPVANKMGFVAGTNIAGGNMSFPGVVGTVITKFYEKFIGKTGLTEREAKAEGFRTLSTTIRAPSRARYYPGGSEIVVKLISEEGSKRLIGGQLMGNEEVLGRLDLLASAVAAGMTVEQLFFVEMGYMPAITEVWDPLIIAARQLMKARSRFPIRG